METSLKRVSMLGAAAVAVACWCAAPLAAGEAPKDDTPAAQATESSAKEGHASCCCCNGGAGESSCSRPKAEGAHAHHGAHGGDGTATADATPSATDGEKQGGCCCCAGHAAKGDGEKSGCC